MKIVNVPGYGPVSFPDEMPDGEIQERARRIQEKAEAKFGYKPDYRELGLGELVKGGFKRSTSRLGSTVTDLIPAMLGTAVGEYDYAREQLKEAEEKRAAAEAASPTAFRTYKDVRGPGDFLGFLAETGGEITPDIASTLVGGGIAGALTKRAAAGLAEREVARRAAETAARKQLDDAAAADYAARLSTRAAPAVEQAAASAGAAGMGAGFFGTSLGTNAPDIFQNIYEKTGNLDIGTSLLFGVGQSALDSILPARIASQFSREAKDKAFNELVQRSTVVPPSVKQRFGIEVAKSTGLEGVTESAQEILGIMAEITAGSGESLFSQDNIDRIINAGIKGAVGGGLFGTPGAVVEARRQRDVAEQIQQLRQALETPPAPPPAAPVAPPVPPTPPLSPMGVAPQAPRPAPEVEAIRGWTDANLKATLDFQKSKPPEQQNAELVQRVEAEIARRQAGGAPDVRPPITPTGGEGVGVAGVAAERPAAGGAGETAPPRVVPTGADVGAPPTGEVGAPPSVVEPPAAPPVEPPAAPPVEPPVAPPVAPPVEPPAPTAPEGVSRETLIEQIQKVRQEMMSLLTPGGRTPFKNSPARAKFDVLQAQLDALGKQWTALTGTGVSAIITGAAAPAAPAPAAPAPTPPAAPAAPADLTQRIADLKAQWQQAAAENNAERMRELNDQIIEAKKQLEVAPEGETAPPAPTYWEEFPVKVIGEPFLEGGVSYTQVKFQNAAGTFEGEGARTSYLPTAEISNEPRPPQAQKQKGKKTKAAEPAPAPAPKAAAPAPKAPAPAPKPSVLDDVDVQSMTEEDVGVLQAAKKVQDQYSAISRFGLQKNANEVDSMEDRVKVAKLVGRKGAAVKGTDMEKAVMAYFGKTPRVVDALDAIAFDLAYDNPGYRAYIPKPEELREYGITPEAMQNYFQGTGGDSARLAAEWTRRNLSPEARAQFDGFLAQYRRERELTEIEAEERAARERQIRAEQKRIAKEAEETKAQAQDVLRAAMINLNQVKAKFGEGSPQYIKAEDDVRAAQDRAAELEQDAEETAKAVEPTKAEKKARADAFEEKVDKERAATAALQNALFKPLSLEEVSPYSRVLHPRVAAAVEAGDLPTALMLLAQFQGDTGNMARALLAAKINPTISVVENLTNEAGQRVPGVYDPTTNAIQLDRDLGLNEHTFFHESGHAATSHVLENPSHPVTKQLNTLFNDVKDSLDTAYGARSLDEFVAEAWGNSAFKAKLAAINPKGGPITAWQRFVNIIQNFFRRLMGKESKPVESAFDVADRNIRAILSPAPAMREGERLYAAVANPKAPVVDQFFEGVAKQLERLPFMTTERADAVHEFLKNTAGSMGRNIMLSTLPQHALRDVAKKYIPQAERITRLFDERGADENMRNEKIEPVVELAETRVKKWGPELTKRFNNVVYDSTTKGVDPTRPPQYYVDKYTSDLPYRDEVLDIHYDLNRELDAIPGGRELYTKMKDVYAKLYDEVKAAIGVRINDAVDSEEMRVKMKDYIFQKLVEKGDIDPYFPLTRSGDYWLSYSAPDRTGRMEFFVRAYENERERNRDVAELEQMRDSGVPIKDISVYANMSEISYRNAPPSSYVHGVMKMMEQARPKSEVDRAKYDVAMEQILKLFLSTLPETSFAQALQTRKGTEGYSRDSVRALREKAYSISRQISNMKYAALLNKERQDMREHVISISKEGGEDNKVAKQYADELDARIDVAISPTISNWSRLATSFGFNYLLGFNISSALVNLTQVPLIVLPYLGGKYGLGQSQRAIREATRVYSGSGLQREVEVYGTEGETAKRKAMPSIDNYDFDDPNLSPEVKKYATLARVARDMGQLNRSMLYDVLEVDGRKNPLAAVNAASGFFFHHGERMNRQVAMMATYNLELERLKKAEPGLSQAEREQRAAEEAVYVSQLTNGGVSAASAPRIAQNSLGKVLFMFKSYGVSMYYLLYKITREAFGNQPPEVQKAARKQLAYIFGTAALFSGLRGLPLFGVLAMIYDMFKEDDDEDFGTVVRSNVGELWYKGLVNSITGLSIAERTGLSDLIFRENPFAGDQATLADNFANYFGGPVYGAASRIKRGMDLISEGELQRGVEAIMPVAVSNVLKSYRFATEGANTMRGDPIVGDIGAWNVAAQMLGFTPAEYTKQLEINAALKGIDKTVTTNRSKYLQQMNVARREGDTAEYTEARTRLEKLYVKHPTLGSQSDMEETIARSQRSFDTSRPKLYHGVTLSNAMRDELLVLAKDLEE